MARKQDVHYLVNVGYHDIHHNTNLGFFFIPKPNREAGELFGKPTLVEEGINKFDLGDSNQFTSPLEAATIAEDVARQYSHWGVFASPNAIPTKAELAKANAELDKYLRKMLKDGDSEWSKHQKQENIDDNSKIAARHFGLERPWSFEPGVKNLCPFCETNMKPGAAICPTGCVVDIDKAYKAGRISKSQAEELEHARRAPQAAKKAAPKEATA